MTDMKPCRICGTPFKMSRTDYAVHCPAHRGRAVEAALVRRRADLCYCGKTVLTYGVTCPRECGPAGR